MYKPSEPKGLHNWSYASNRLAGYKKSGILSLNIPAMPARLLMKIFDASFEDLTM